MSRLKPIVSALTFLSLLLLLAGVARAETVSAEVFKATQQGQGESLGTVTFTDTQDGITITTNLRGLPPGQRGFHIHEHGDCGPAPKDGNVVPAQAAGGHYDPEKTGKHLGPEGGGHKGDLPVLTVAQDGTANVTMQVRGIKAAEFKGRAVMIHEGGDNYSDQPEPLGGGGARFGCGVIK